MPCAALSSSNPAFKPTGSSGAAVVISCCAAAVSSCCTAYGIAAHAHGMPMRSNESKQTTAVDYQLLTGLNNSRAGCCKEPKAPCKATRLKTRMQSCTSPRFQLHQRQQSVSAVLCKLSTVSNRRQSCPAHNFLPSKLIKHDW